MPENGRRLVEPLIDDRWTIQGTFAYVKPIRWVLRGALAERSSRRGSSLWVLRMPLYFPARSITLNWSDRIAPSTTYEPKDPDTESSLKRIIKTTLRECRDDVALAGHPAVIKRDLNMTELAAYGLLLQGDADASVELLRRVEDGAEVGEPAWVAEMAERAAGMRDLIESGETSGAIAKLELWRSQTVSALGIELGERPASRF